MIDMRQAVQIAKHKGAELLDTSNLSLEEVERSKFSRRDVWAITLGVPSDSVPGAISPFARVDRKYRRFFIDVDSGELLAVKMREATAA